MILLGWCTGAREGDCAELRFDQVKEYESGFATLRFLPKKKEKAGKEIEIPIIEPLRSHLAGLSHSTGPLCPTLHKTPVGTGRGLSAQFREIVEEAGIVVVEESGTGEPGAGSPGQGISLFPEFFDLETKSGRGRSGDSDADRGSRFSCGPRWIHSYPHRGDGERDGETAVRWTQKSPGISAGAILSPRLWGKEVLMGIQVKPVDQRRSPPFQQNQQQLCCRRRPGHLQYHWHPI